MNDLIESLIISLKNKKLSEEIFTIILCFFLIEHWVLTKMININILERLFLSI